MRSIAVLTSAVLVGSATAGLTAASSTAAQRPLPGIADAADRADRADRGGQVLRVGPGRALEAPSEAAAVARDGDRVEIDAGSYPGDVATWSAHDLTLTAVGGKVVLDADGESAQGKAIWVVSGDDVTVRGITFSNATVPDGNGAGIRAEGAGLRILRCRFLDNENGILTTDNADSVVRIRRSRFARNGAGDGYTHNLYVGRIKRLDVRGSSFEAADGGHEIKSRAVRTGLFSNRLRDLDAATSYSVDLPDGGRALLVGNVIEQGTGAVNRTLISYGAESLRPSGNALRLANNTLVNLQGSGTFVRVPSEVRAVLRNTLVRGRGTLVDGPSDRSATVRTRRGFVDPGAGDYRLRASSPAIDAGRRVPRSQRARWEFRPPASYVARQRVGRIDVGAFERQTPAETASG